MGKTLYVHVGHYKTGTTALQTFLSHNPRFLAKNDLLYCESWRNLSKHSALAFSLYRAAGVTQLMHGYRKKAPPETFWAEVLDEVRRAKPSRAIVSSEEFMRMGCYPEAAQRLAEIFANAPDIEVRVIAYLREPDAHLKSWYNQLVKMGIPTPAYNTAVPSMIEAVHYDFALAMKPWVDLVGADRVILRKYPGNGGNGDGLHKDFLSIFGLQLPDRDIQLPARDPNPRLDDRIVELTRVLNSTGLPAAAIERTVDRAQRYLEAESAGVPTASEQDFDALRQRSLAGLDALEAMLPQNPTVVAALREHPPHPATGDAADGWRIAGLLLSEISQLRKNVTKTTRELDERIKALEETVARQDENLP